MIKNIYVLQNYNENEIEYYFKLVWNIRHIINYLYKQNKQKSIYLIENIIKYYFEIDIYINRDVINIIFLYL